MTAACEISKIQTIGCTTEMRAYWRCLGQEQPAMAQHPDVIAAKQLRETEFLERERKHG